MTQAKWRIAAVTVAFIGCLLPARAAQTPRPGYVVVASRAALSVLEPLLELRRQQCEVAVLTTEELAEGDTALTADQIKAAIRARHSKRPLTYLLLVGDTRAGRDGLGAVPAHPTGFDSWYGVLATDGPKARPATLHQPAMAVGRFPASSLAELRAMVDKTVAYETGRRPGPWQGRIHVVAGTANFGPVADALIDRAVMAVLDGAVPRAYAITVTRGLTSSPYCVPPDEFEGRVVELFDEGALFVTYLGHGNARSAYRVRGFMNGKMMDCGTMARLRCRPERRPIAVFIACSMGHFDGSGDCVAEAALKNPGGPVACVASTRRNHVYGNAIFGLELTRALFDEREATLGACVVRALRRLTGPPAQLDPIRLAITGLALADPKARVPAAMHAGLLADHVYLYGLLGDPALRIARPSKQVTRLEAAPGRGGWIVSGEVPGLARGSATVTLEIPRAGFRGPIEAVSPDDPEWRKTMRRNYAAANDKVLTTVRAAVRDGKFSAGLPTPVPWEPDGRGHLIRVIAIGARAVAIASIPAPPGAGPPRAPKHGDAP